MEQFGSYWTDFHEIWCRYLSKSLENIQVSLESKKNKGILHEDLRTFTIISRRVILRMRNISDQCGRENQNMHFIFKNVFRKSCRL